MNVDQTMEVVTASVRTMKAASPAHAVWGMSLNLEMAMTPPMQDGSVKVPYSGI